MSAAGAAVLGGCSDPVSSARYCAFRDRFGAPELSSLPSLATTRDCFPSATALQSSRTMTSMERMESSFPAMAISTRSGSPSVSMSPMVGIPSLRASRSAVVSRLTSMTTMTPGSLFMLRMPSRLRLILRISRRSCDSIFLE